MARIFIAIDIPDNCCNIVRDRLAVWRSYRSDSRADIRWVRSDNLHLTLKFLGDVSEDRLDLVYSASRQTAASHDAFPLYLSGTGVFPGTDNPRVLWIGIKGALDALCSLQGDLDLLLERAGFPTETRPFSPHLTTGRVRSRRRIARFLNTYLEEPIESAPFDVKEIAIYKSEITGNGPLYHILARYPLGKVVIAAQGLS
ncbi:RNA 2',3'-cyclic phosphodiesterase [Dissulfurimicrobium hydrothermale]|uniref:RNA 2',3'-cyclic phosphodiesterase n=1 Tax=Dissulfurimicrobium hydrothermale TaxID=1750598 RepID=UPI001EDC3795|nr:RNA 2',3'-cyclic phosphodiesterase [Dissulfurimicrobium hydrothermale]UKL13982.1 RNA 2',3'-cyclic phosphodiesterase [Dissulfurimicrobium hydrothermale]